MNERCAIQISDRRLTSNGVLLDDEANKAIALTTPDARLTLGFSGLARTGTFNTRDWIMASIKTAAIVDASAGGIITRFAKIATKTFNQTLAIKRVGAAYRRLDVVFSGYLQTVAPPLMVYAWVSNQQADGSTGDFSIQWHNEARPSVGVNAWLSPAGNCAGVQPDDFAEIEAALVKLVSPQDLQAVLHSRMVKIASRPASAGTIGKQFDTIILERQGGPARTMYDSAVVKPEMHMPAMIVVHGPNQVSMVKDVSVWSGDRSKPFIVPRVHRNHLCPCGSGKRYRECHRLN